MGRVLVQLPKDTIVEILVILLLVVALVVRMGWRKPRKRKSRRE